MNVPASSEPSVPTSAPVVEWAPFRVRPGISDEQVLAASARLQEGFLRHQPGFIRRELLKGADRQWIDYVVWRDRSAADAAVQQAMQSPTCADYFGIMESADPINAGDGLTHFRLMHAY
jgi:hypothetical protein